MSFIPIVLEPYPDELLYSWINRLAKANGITLRWFGRTYINQLGIYSGELPYEIRNEFIYLYKSIATEMDYASVYEKHSTFRMDMLFRLEKYANRYLNLISQYSTNSLNPPISRSIKDLCVCPDCMNEDKDKYGYPYIHVSHNIADVKYCGKHLKRLHKFIGKRSHECEYKPADYKPVDISHDETLEADYSRYLYELYNSGISCTVEALKRAYIERVNTLGYSIYSDGLKRLTEDFNGSKYAPLLDKPLQYCINNYILKKKSVEARDFVPMLMFVYNDPKDIAKSVKNKPFFYNRECKECGEKYLDSYENSYSMQLCPDCYIKIPLQERFEYMVDLIGNKEYTALNQYESLNKRMKFKHSCGRTNSFILRNFFYGQSRCECERDFDDEWNERIDLLEKYKEEYGTVSVKKTEVYKGFKLGAWLQYAKRQKHKNALPTDKELRMIELGVDFTLPDEAREKRFKEQLDIYRQYVKATGKYHVERTVVFKAHNLGSWYDNLRKKCNSGRLSKDDLKAIRSIYKDFPLIPPKEKAVKPQSNRKIVPFSEAVEMLIEYQKEYGTMNIPKSREYKGYKLGIWANQMRSKKTQDILPKDQIKRLDEIGFDWDPLATKWNNDLSRYERYVKATGKLEIPKEERFEDFSIGYWYSNLKVSRKNNSLSEQQRKDILKINPFFLN